MCLVCESLLKGGDYIIISKGNAAKVIIRSMGSFTPPYTPWSNTLIIMIVYCHVVMRLLSCDGSSLEESTEWYNTDEPVLRRL